MVSTGSSEIDAKQMSVGRRLNALTHHYSLALPVLSTSKKELFLSQNEAVLLTEENNNTLAKSCQDFIKYCS